MERLDVPIVCNLGAIGDGERPGHVERSELLFASCVGHTEEADGVALRYPASAELLAAAGEWIGRERLCCAFFDFELTAPAGGEEFTIRLSGGPGVKEFILENFVRGGAAAGG